MKVCRIAYLGPPGTFCHDAARALFDDASVFLPNATIPAVLQSVESGAVDGGVVPVENSFHGEATATIDSLVFDFSTLRVTAETVVPVTLCAFVKAGDDAPPRLVLSHPHALAQCRRFIEQLGGTARSTESTARACEEVAAATRSGLAAIGSKAAGEQYGLRLLHSGVEDLSGGRTKFYAIGRSTGEARGPSKSLVAVVPRSHDAGVLVQTLGVFSRRHLDIFSIHSRPLRSELGRYCFVITFEGHALDPLVETALLELITLGARVKFLGSFSAFVDDHVVAQTTAIPGLATTPQEFRASFSVTP